MGIVLPQAQFGSVNMFSCIFWGAAEPDRRSLDLPLIRETYTWKPWEQIHSVLYNEGE